MKKAAAIGLIALFGSMGAQAQITGFYVGASFLDTQPEWLSHSDDDNGLEARVGYSLNSLFAFEASYLELGTVDLPNFPDAGGSADSEAYTVSGVVSLPLGNLSLFGRAGYLWSQTDGYFGTIAGPMRSETDDSELYFGAGVSVEIFSNLDVRLEYNETDRFNWAGLGLNIRF